MSGRRYFGTDGIRGRVGEGMITPDFVLKLGWAAGRVFGQGNGGKVLIGKDTRISGYMFESALEAGLVAAGVNIRLLGPMTTPGVAYLTRTFRASAGIVITASHNPYQDNGIKFFSADGDKLPDDVEEAIEAEARAALAHGRLRRARQGEADRRRQRALHRVLQEYCSREHEFSRTQGRGRLRKRRDLQHRALCLRRARCGGRAPRYRSGRVQHQPRCRLDPSRCALPGGRAGRGRSRHRLRRRRRPGADGRRQRAADRRRSAPVRHREGPPCRGCDARRRRRHPDEQPRLRACVAASRGRIRAGQGRRPLHHGAAEALGRHPRRRALRTHHLSRPHQHG